MGNETRREIVLVTGFPRLIARLVCTQVLESAPGRVVRLLVREKFHAEAREFVREHPERARIELLDGDAAAIDLGLSGAEYRDLAGEVDYVLHHAHVSYEGADRRTAEALNVQGAREILELARVATRLKRVVHQSTVRVSGDREGRVTEGELEAGQSFRSAIEDTMYRAERLMRNAIGTVPITVIRPSFVVGHSQTGAIDRLDGPYLLILLLLTAPAEFALPMPSRGDALLHLVPMDYVARATVALMDHPDAAGRTLHLVDRAAPSVRAAFQSMARSAGRPTPRGFIPVNVTRAVLRTPGLERFVKSPRAFLELLATPVVYASDQAAALLEPMNIRCPPFDSYVDTMIAHVRERLTARRARGGDLSAEIEDPLA